MKRYLQQEPLLVQQVETSQWLLPVHTHDFYELILIGKGSGYHIINDNRFPYTTGDVYFLGPSDHHSFSVVEKTQFCFLTFTDAYLSGLANVKNTVWKRIKTYSLHTTQGFTGSLVKTATDQQHLNALLSILLSEQKGPRQLSSPIVDALMGVMLSLIERQITQQQLKSIHTLTPSADLIPKIIAYICQHIMQPESLRIEQLADVFHYSPGHLSALFKQQVGESLQHYIIQYKLKLVEKRLRLSSLTVSQIADEFGFTDICHLNKLFKRYYRHTPMVYRRVRV
ncbi:helix-turn-helix transcriptional regulator [Larkinella humicola]|uniref:AraC family transcriptional regulator n=1 Tax=Larkinella humicola TaxID=2607654 RepID=A0A5N1JCY4_9BACT|nr:AraC family transcriptional regulator [Larkinella humicola]KAA9352963.1 AraC family transcriptional regulator [Larkinella humicola]